MTAQTTDASRTVRLGPGRTRYGRFRIIRVGGVNKGARAGDVGRVFSTGVTRNRMTGAALFALVKVRVVSIAERSLVRRVVRAVDNRILVIVTVITRKLCRAVPDRRTVTTVVGTVVTTRRLTTAASVINLRTVKLQTA